MPKFFVAHMTGMRMGFLKARGDRIELDSGTDPEEKQ
jgi:hypothetical protein